MCFEDLIIDIMVLPNGEFFILDEDELPEPIEQFENGTVKHALGLLMDSIETILPQAISESDHKFKHIELLYWLNKP